jgi:nitrate reductase delta subunit
MEATRTLLETLAIVLEYPSHEGTRNIRAGLHALEALGAQAEDRADVEMLRSGVHGLEALSQEEREELYTRCFDINPTASLELGWHLYGEQYERGSFLVLMREALRNAGIDEGGELPDHISLVLRFVARLDGASRREFARLYLQRALRTMREKWQSEHHPYVHCLEAVYLFIEDVTDSHEGEHRHA